METTPLRTSMGQVDASIRCGARILAIPISVMLELSAISHRQAAQSRMVALIEASGHNTVAEQVS